MPKIGTIVANLHTVDRDEVVYARTGNTVSHTDNIALRRTTSTKPGQPLRTNVRFERGFQIAGTVNGLEKSVTVSIAVTVPPGASAADVKHYVKEALTEAAATAADMSVSGDIHLEA